MLHSDEAEFAKRLPLTRAAIRAIAPSAGTGSAIPRHPDHEEVYRFKTTADRDGKLEQVVCSVGSCASRLPGPNTVRFENSGSRALEREMSWFLTSITRPSDDWAIEVSRAVGSQQPVKFEVKMVAADGPGWVTVCAWRAPDVSDGEACILFNVAVAARTSGSSWYELRAKLRDALYAVHEEQFSGPRR